jgi:hypothetical protein
MITRDTNIEELVWAYQGFVGFLIQEGLPCVICGEPFWGSLEDLALQKGWDDDRIDKLVDRLNAHFR